MLYSPKIITSGCKLCSAEGIVHMAIAIDNSELKELIERAHRQAKQLLMRRADEVFFELRDIRPATKKISSTTILEQHDEEFLPLLNNVKNLLSRTLSSLNDSSRYSEIVKEVGEASSRIMPAIDLLRRDIDDILSEIIDQYESFGRFGPLYGNREQYRNNINKRAMMRRARTLINELNELAELKAISVFLETCFEIFNSMSIENYLEKSRASSIIHSIYMLIENNTKTIWSEFINIIFFQDDHSKLCGIRERISLRIKTYKNNKQFSHFFNAASAAINASLAIATDPKTNPSTNLQSGRADEWKTNHEMMAPVDEDSEYQWQNTSSKTEYLSNELAPYESEENEELNEIEPINDHFKHINNRESLPSNSNWDNREDFSMSEDNYEEAINAAEAVKISDDNVETDSYSDVPDENSGQLNNQNILHEHEQASRLERSKRAVSVLKNLIFAQVKKAQFESVKDEVKKIASVVSKFSSNRLGITEQFHQKCIQEFTDQNVFIVPSENIVRDREIQHRGQINLELLSLFFSLSANLTHQCTLSEREIHYLKSECLFVVESIHGNQLQCLNAVIEGLAVSISSYASNDALLNESSSLQTAYSKATNSVKALVCESRTALIKELISTVERLISGAKRFSIEQTLSSSHWEQTIRVAKILNENNLKHLACLKAIEESVTSWHSLISATQACSFASSTEEIDDDHMEHHI